MYLYKVGTWSSVLINQVSLFQRCPLREVPLYTLSLKTSFLRVELSTSGVLTSDGGTLLYII